MSHLYYLFIFNVFGIKFSGSETDALLPSDSTTRRCNSIIVVFCFTFFVDEVYTSTWFGFKDLSFLMDKEAARKRRTEEVSSIFTDIFLTYIYYMHIYFPARCFNLLHNKVINMCLPMCVSM